MDVSTDSYLARMAIVEACAFIAAPHVRMRPSIFPDGDQWCCLYGDDLMVGVAGFGDTPEMACAAFDKAWGMERPPQKKQRDRFCNHSPADAPCPYWRGYCRRDPACNN
jgi:hypothetical protein